MSFAIMMTEVQNIHVYSNSASLTEAHKSNYVAKRIISSLHTENQLINQSVCIRLW